MNDLNSNPEKGRSGWPIGWATASNYCTTILNLFPERGAHRFGRRIRGDDDTIRFPGLMKTNSKNIFQKISENSD